MENIEKRRKTLINIAYYGVIIGFFYLFLKYAFWLFFPFLFAFLIAAVMQRPVNFLSGKTHLKKGFVSSILILLMLTVFVLLIIFTGARIFDEIQGLLQWVGTRLDELPKLIVSVRDGLISVAGVLPDGIEKSAVSGINRLFDELIGMANAQAISGITAERDSVVGGFLSNFDFSILSKPVSGVWNTAKQIPTVLVAVIISIIACCFLTTGYDDVVNFIKRQFSMEKRRMLSQAKAIFFSSILKMFKSYITIICITFVEMIIGLSLFRLIGIYKSEYMASVALVVAVVDVFPVLGTGTILIPWAIISFITGKMGLGIGLVVLYAVITVIRQIIEPKLVATNLGLPPIVTIMCMYMGLQLFGVLGIFITPLIATMIKVLNDKGVLHVWKTKESEKIADAVTETEEITEAENKEV